MSSIRITRANAAQYIGHAISFKTRGKWASTTLLGLTPSGHLRIDWMDLGNILTISRKIMVEVD